MDDDIDRFGAPPQDWARIIAAKAHNDPIPEYLKPTAHRLIASGEAQLALLDEQIDGLERTLRELHKSREKKATHIDIYRAAIAPHRKLPPELLSYIFKYTVGRVELPPRLYNGSIFILAQICRKWNLIASDTVALWTNIYIDYTAVRPQDFGRIEKRLFGMSGDLPLSIELHNYVHQKRLFEVPRLYPERCRNLVISGGYQAIQDLFRPHPTASLSSLQNLSIKTIGPRLSGSWALPLLETAVDLRRLTIDGGLHLYKTISQLPLFNLTFLDIALVRLEPPHVLAIMSRCPLLTTCIACIGWLGLIVSPETQREPTLLSSLRHFHLSTDHLDIPWICGAIMPSLAHLIIAGSSFPERESFRSSISHSDCLDILGVETMDLTGLKPILQLTPTISQLQIRTRLARIPSAEILEGLATGELLPRLSKLECMVRGARDVTAYLDMIERRHSQVRPAVSSIKEVRFFKYGNRHVDGLWLPRLNKLREGGLVAHVSEWYPFSTALNFI